MSAFLTGGIRRRLLLWNLSLFGLVVSAIILATYLYNVRQIAQHNSQLQADLASVTASRVETFVKRKIERLIDTALTISLHPVGTEPQQLLSTLLLKNDNSLTEVSIVDAGGLEVVKVSARKIYTPADFSDQSKSEKFRKAIQGDTYISPVYTSDKAEPFVTLAVPLKAASREIVGIVSAEANLRALWEVIGGVRFGAGGYAYLIDGHGNLIAHRDPSLVLRKTNLRHIRNVQNFLRNPAADDPTPAHEGDGITGAPVLSTYAPLRELGWAVVLEEPLAAALRNVKRTGRDSLVLLGLGLFVATIIMIWFSKRITGPIRELHRGVEIIASGNLDHQVRIDTADEIQSLADEFNRMAKELKNSHDTLEQRVKQRTQELSALYDVTTTINQSLELETVLQEVIKKITDIFNFDATRILLFDAVTEELQLRASYETSPKLAAQVMAVKRGQGVTGRVAETGEPVIFENLQTDPRYEQLSDSKANQKAGLCFSATFPIKTKTHCVGVLRCLGQEPRPVSDNEIQLLMSVSNQIGVAVENANLFAAISDKSVALEEANRELQEASRVKSEFMAAMSHELRTPLNIIMGNVELMKERFFGEVTENQIKSLTQITHHARVLLKLINNVLSLTKIEARKMSCDAVPTNLDEIIAHVRGYAEQLGRNGNLQFFWNVEPNLPVITTDPLKLEEIFQNLIGNAYKFTSQGIIEVRVKDLKARKRVEFAVADTGIGIDEADVEKIFQEFHQLKEAHTGRFDGFGLGLNIVKNYLELMRGDIRVESQPGVGSTFTFTLPYSIESQLRMRDQNELG